MLIFPVKVYAVLYKDADGYSDIEEIYTNREAAEKHVKEAYFQAGASWVIKPITVLDEVPAWRLEE